MRTEKEINEKIVKCLEYNNPEIWDWIDDLISLRNKQLINKIENIMNNLRKQDIDDFDGLTELEMLFKEMDKIKNDI